MEIAVNAVNQFREKSVAVSSRVGSRVRVSALLVLCKYKDGNTALCERLLTLTKDVYEERFVCQYP
jgi:hypothetical protein